MSSRIRVRASPGLLLCALLAGCAAQPEVGEDARRTRPSETTTGEIPDSVDEASPAGSFGERLDRSHDWLYINAQQLVEATDRRLAPDDVELMAVPATPFRLGFVIESIDRADGNDLDLDLDLDVSLRLPNLERRLRIFITNDDVAEAPNVAGEEQSLRAGVRFNPLRRIDFDIGIKADVPPVAFTSLKWSARYGLGQWDIYPFVKLFLETDDGLGSSGALTFDRWAGSTLFRSASFARWRKDRDATEWTQTFQLAHVGELTEPDRYGSLVKGKDIARGFGLRLLASGERTAGADYYEASIYYKRPIRHRWLYAFIEPLVRWDKEYDWEADPGIRIGFDALFWDLARSRPEPIQSP